MKKRQTWFKNLKQWAFRFMVSGVIFTSTVVGLSALFVYAATTLPGFKSINDDYQLTFAEWKETVAHLFWRTGSVAGEIVYTGDIAVIGGARIGNTTAGCSASNAGNLKYVDRCLSYCNGSNWTQVSCVTYSWVGGSRGSCSATSPTIGSRGACSASCGGGTQTRTCTATNGTQSRTVQCKGSDGSVVADNMCSGTKPGTSQTCAAGCSGISTSQSCNTSACTTYSWNSGSRGSCSATNPTIGSRGACSASCGGGTRTRTCTTLSGTQTRTVQCKDSDGSVVADSMCSGTKPATSTTCAAGCGGTSTSETCNTQACPTRGVCGTAHNTNRISAPSTAAEKCSLGTASSVSGSGPRTWTCAGVNGGNPSSTCTANKACTAGVTHNTSAGTITVTDCKKSITIQDKNLGATVSGTGSTSYGYYFQWGNNYGFANNGTLPSRSSTKTDAGRYASPSTYNNDTFITVGDDWSSTQNDNLRGGSSSDGPTTIPTGTNAIHRQGPCPAGYHVPSQGEWNQLLITRAGINSVSLRDSSVYKYLNDSANVPKFRNDLLLPLAGSRICDAAASVSYQGYNGNYWSSSPSGTYARKLDLTTSDVGAYDYNPRANGFSLRCFKNS